MYKTKSTEPSNYNFLALKFSYQGECAFMCVCVQVTIAQNDYRKTKKNSLIFCSVRFLNVL